jgi:hypothetical protein
MTTHAANPSTADIPAVTKPQPVPQKDAGRDRPTPEGDALDPTRYGDWEKNGRCIDF